MRTLQIGMIVVLIAMALPGCFVANRMSGVSQAKELHKTGEAAEAQILRVWDTGMTVNNDPVVGLLLDVRPSGRASYQAETKALISRIDVPQFQPGNLVPVRIDPGDPLRVSVDVYEY